MLFSFIGIHSYANAEMVKIAEEKYGVFSYDDKLIFSEEDKRLVIVKLRLNKNLNYKTKNGINIDYYIFSVVFSCSLNSQSIGNISAYKTINGLEELIGEKHEVFTLPVSISPNIGSHDNPIGVIGIIVCKKKI